MDWNVGDMMILRGIMYEITYKSKQGVDRKRRRKDTLS